MSEQSICAARASVMLYDDTSKKWVPSGSSSGLSKVQIYHNTANETFRVVGRQIKNHEVVINCAILKGLKYNQATATFHQWRDNRQVYGLNFSNKDDADNFAKSMLNSLQILNVEVRQAIPPPPPPHQVPLPPSSSTGSLQPSSQPTQPALYQPTPPQAPPHQYHTLPTPHYNDEDMSYRFHNDINNSIHTTSMNHYNSHQIQQNHNNYNNQPANQDLYEKDNGLNHYEQSQINHYEKNQNNHFEKTQNHYEKTQNHYEKTQNHYEKTQNHYEKTQNHFDSNQINHYEKSNHINHYDKGNNHVNHYEKTGSSAPYEKTYDTYHPYQEPRQIQENAQNIQQPPPLPGHHRTSSAPGGPPPVISSNAGAPPPAPPMPAVIGAAPPPPPPPPPAPTPQSIQDSFVSAVKGAKLKPTKAPDSESTGSSSSGGSIGRGPAERSGLGTMMSMMDEMAATLARRRARSKEQQSPTDANKSASGVPPKSPVTSTSSLTNGRCSAGPESPKHSRKRFGSTCEDLGGPKVNGFSGTSTSGSQNNLDMAPLLERMKEEIVCELTKELHKCKQEIINEIKMELNRR